MVWLIALTLALDLATIKSEPNLEKRSDRALDYANQALDTSRDAYGRGEFEQAQMQLSEVESAVDLAQQALEQTGKDPRRNPRAFKRAEMRTRELMRRLDGLIQTVSFADREPVEKVRDHVAAVHDKLLEGIMSKGK